MVCKHSLPSGADLDLVIREREMIEANSHRYALRLERGARQYCVCCPE